ncbi:toxin-antitoxin system HicB family antitoxin [Thermaerobacter sp. PB12/4term]|uniref:type II toxin-antitoxin system HicB family antitoxin n=1 Tax=Thermaerobacter sp. PB12/4term TaxID=2293838 RepID=UPI000E32A74B|nr:type II toxin-antitoxin system HicB family antitoxin [Thermaerobacter sp. PB12/4term]QIA26722.1 toxin-antitoxin system HicB family antitoxin [Thermaerobacter sp. PB12/4term]
MSKQIRIRYPFIVEQVEEEDGSVYWEAEVPDLPGCAAAGETLDELIETLAEMIDAWIESAKQRGQEIPEPSTVENYSGKVLLRMPPTLHRRLALMAKRNRISLNSQIVNALHYNIGRESAPRTYIHFESTPETTSSRPVYFRTKSITDYGHGGVIYSGRIRS